MPHWRSKFPQRTLATVPKRLEKHPSATRRISKVGHRIYTRRSPERPRRSSTRDNSFVNVKKGLKRKLENIKDSVVTSRVMQNRRVQTGMARLYVSSRKAAIWARKGRKSRKKN